MSKTLVIAEPGCTHEGDKATLLKLLETAAECGADVFKPQWTSDPAQMCARRHIGTDHPKRSYYERAYTWLAFPVAWHAEFRDRCYAFGMRYACTSFLPVDVWRVDPYVDIHKIASCEAKDQGLSWTARSTGKRVVVSTGMLANDDLRELLYGESVARLLCTASYPAPLNAVNLLVMRHMGLQGLSDHTRNLVTGAAAVGAGATIIEAHFRLFECDPENPDYAVAFTPAEFTQYIQNIRDAELMLGDGVKRIQECERDMLPYRVTA